MSALAALGDRLPRDQLAWGLCGRLHLFSTAASGDCIHLVLLDAKRQISTYELSVSKHPSSLDFETRNKNMDHFQPIIRLLGWFRAFGIVGGLIGWFLLGIPIFGVIWTFCEAAGVPGSRVVFLVLALLASVIALLLILAAKPLQWFFTYKTLEHYVRERMASDALTADTVLCGDGPGAAIIGGMLTKVLQADSRPVPPLVILDLDYDENGTATIGTYAQLSEGALENKAPMIVLSAVTTGNNLKAMKQIPSLVQAKVFTFVVEPSFRGEIDYAVVRGGREVLPWARHEGTLRRRE